jgi:hypothetical protein
MTLPWQQPITRHKILPLILIKYQMILPQIFSSFCYRTNLHRLYNRLVIMWIQSNIVSFYPEPHNLNFQYFNHVHYEKLHIMETEDERERTKAFPAQWVVVMQSDAVRFIKQMKTELHCPLVGWGSYQFTAVLCRWLCDIRAQKPEP